jgi:hypothetical protein
MSEERNSLQEELAWSNRQPARFHGQERETVKIASCGESPTFSFSGEHSGLQRPH